MFVYVKHPPEVVQRVHELVERGLPLLRISRITGVERQTIRRWRTKHFELQATASSSWIPGSDYVYVLGLYLGDGCLALPGRCRRHVLDIASDGKYSSILDEATSALQVAFPHAPIRRYQGPATRCVNLRITHAALLSAFPQHGPGRKHTRKIELVDWQRALTHRFPEAFLRGLIHSDGSRCINQVNTTLPSGREAHYEYVRYFFTNYSADIRRIFCEHCDLLGIRWTQSNSRNISISHRDSTAILDRIVGPKT